MVVFFQFQKLIKNLPAADDADQADQAAREASNDSDASSIDESSSPANGSRLKQDGGDATVERASSKRPRKESSFRETAQLPAAGNQNQQDTSTPPLGQSPGETTFFKFLHAELKKAKFFFAQTTKEFQIREERVRKGMEVIKGQERSMAEKWRTMSQALYSLYKDLLLFETFAIMTYVGFSKILKKHDKITGYRTCNAYMESIVNGANFTHYPEVMSMVSRCESLYEEISEALEHEGIKALSEDEQLFISMIQRVGAEVLMLGNDKVNGSPRRPSFASQPVPAESQAVDDLRELLADDSNGAEGGIDDDDTSKQPPTKKLARR